MTFTLLPLVFSLVLAFTNWDIRFHNMFKDVPLQFVGFQNFVRLFHEPDFPKYLGNTLFLMMNIPLAIAIVVVLITQAMLDARARAL